MARAAGGGQSLLFARDAVVPPLPGADHACIGVDVGGMRKGLHAVAILPSCSVEMRRARDPADIVDWCLALDARTVAVDAPCRWSVTGRARSGERALYAEGIHAYATPTLAVACVKPFYAWMLNGAALYLRLAEHYAEFTGRHAAQRTYLETYPQAVACALAARVVRARNKRADRRALLARAGIDAARLPNIDYVDAALCAVAARYAEAGHYRAYGDRAEGWIVVPRARSLIRPAA